MGGKSILFASVVLALSALGARAQAADGCQVVKVVEMPIHVTPGMRARVTVKINGVDTTFTVDSGAFFSVMNTATVHRLGLSTQMAPFGYAVRGFSGTDNRVDIATATHFQLGPIDVPRVPFLALPDVEPGSAGLLGQNVLSLFDTEYDIANGVIRIMKPSSECTHANLAYWSAGKDVGVVDAEPINETQRHLRGTIEINGHKLKAMFDTGSPTSMIRRAAAERVGFRVDGPGVEAHGAGKGIGSRAFESWTAPFDLIDIGGEQIRHTRLQVAEFDALGEDMILGFDFFLSHRIYVSKQQRKIFFTYNGGEVFHLHPPTRDPQTAANLPPGGAPAAAGAPADADRFADNPTDAAGYARRAEAAVARRDYASALRDFSKAIELDPANPQPYLQRAAVHAAAGEAVLAMADYEQVLKMRPGDPQALVGRGRLYLISHDLVRGRADLDAAVKADPNLALPVAGIYANNRQVEPALQNLDLWIGAHSDASNLAEVFMERCRVRTMANRDLDKALADCEAAIRRGPRTAAMFETRGLVRLRRGEAELALADFNQALREQPKLAWALYGRSLVERGKGQIPAADADLSAATGMAPRLLQAARQYGFEGSPPKAAATAG